MSVASMERMDTCAFVLAVDPDTRKVGGMAVTWLTRWAHEGWAVSLAESSHTLSLIRRSGQFVLAFATPELVEEFTHFGATTGHSGGDKLAETGLRTGSFSSPDIRVPLLADAHANIACEVRGEFPSDVSNDLGYVMVLGAAIEQAANPGTKQLFYQGRDAAGERVFATIGPTP